MKHVLLLEMDASTERIIMVAMELAERDGYDAVRLRDVAEKAQVALGTVYRRFSCKEDILAAVLNFHVGALSEGIRSEVPPGKTPEARLCRFFEQITSLLADRPKMAAAMLRTVASGVPDLVDRVTRYHSDMTDVILRVMRGGDESLDDISEAEEARVAHLLQDIWFATLVGWTGGLHDSGEVVKQLKEATRLLLAGARAK